MLATCSLSKSFVLQSTLVLPLARAVVRVLGINGSAASHVLHSEVEKFCLNKREGPRERPLAQLQIPHFTFHIWTFRLIVKTNHRKIETIDVNSTSKLM